MQRGRECRTKSLPRPTQGFGSVNAVGDFGPLRSVFDLRSISGDGQSVGSVGSVIEAPFGSMKKPPVLASGSSDRHDTQDADGQIPVYASPPVTTIRVTKRTRFTVIDRATVNDGRLSFRARGVLLWLLDKPDDWQTDSNAIARAGTEGRDAVRASLKELEACGYLVRNKRQTAGGQWITDIEVHERPAQPTPENPSSGGKPGPGKPTPGSQALSTEDSLPKTDGSSAIASLPENRKLPDQACIRCRGGGLLYGTENPRPCSCTFIVDPGELLTMRRQ